MSSHAHVQLSNSYPFSKPASSKLQLWITDVHCTIIMQTARHGGSPCPKLVDYRWCGSARNACKSGYFRSTTAWTIYHFWTLCHFCDVDIWCSCKSGYFRSTRMEIFMMMISMRSLDSDIQKTYELAQMYRVFFFNCSSQFSVPKWKTMGSQSEILFHGILNLQKILVGWTTFFFLALKFGRNS